MDKCSLCGKRNIYCKSNDASLINTDINEPDNIQILADRLLQFEGYERTNKDYPIWVCEECRKSLENFAKLLQTIKKSREKQPLEETINRDKNEFRDLNNSEIQENSSSSRSLIRNNIEDTADPFSEPRKKRVRRPPKRFLDNNVYMPPKPIKIQKIKTNNPPITSFEAFIPTISVLRLATGRIIGQLKEADNRDISSKFRITCTICNLVFCFEREFRKHLKRHQDELTATPTTHTNSWDYFLYYCEICEKSFREHFAVRRHYKQAHSLERPFQCTHCPAQFKYKFNFDYHLAKHLNKRNFQCSLCSKNFILRYELMLHQRTHTKEKPYKCQLCSISFAHRSNLVTHRLLHTQKKTFKCSRCQATFKCLAYLRKHEKSHAVKCKANLLQTSPSPSFIKLDIEGKKESNETLQNIENTIDLPPDVANVALNTALPNFNTLQSTLMSARINYNPLNIISSDLNPTDVSVDVSNTQDHEILDNGFHGLTFENNLSSSSKDMIPKPDSYQIIKIPKTKQQNYQNIMLANGEMIQTQIDNKSSLPTLKLILKPPQPLNNVHEILENSQLEQQQNKDVLPSFPIDNNENLRDFQNSPNSTLMTIDHESNSTQQMGNFNQFHNSPVMNIDHESNSTQQNDCNFNQFHNSPLMNTDHESNSTQQMGNFNQFQNSPLVEMEVNSNLSLTDTEDLSFIPTKAMNYENSTIYSSFNSQDNFQYPLENNLNSNHKHNDMINFQNCDNSKSYRNEFKLFLNGNSTKSSNVVNQEEIFIETTEHLNDFANSISPQEKPRLLKVVASQEKLVEPGKNIHYDSFSNVSETNSSQSPNLQNHEHLFSSTNIDVINNFHDFSIFKNSPKKSILVISAPNQEKSNCAFKNSSYDTVSNVIKTNLENSTNSPNTQIEENHLNSTDIETNYNFTDSINLKNSPKKSTLLVTELTQEQVDTTRTNKSYDSSFSNMTMTNLKNSTQLAEPQNVIFSAESNLNTPYNLDKPSENNIFVNLDKRPKQISVLNLKDNPLLTNFNGKTPICVPISNIHVKSFKLVNISGDYLKSKFKTFNNSSVVTLAESAPVQNSAKDLDRSIAQMPKLNYFVNKKKLINSSPSTSSTIKLLESSNDLAEKNSQETGSLPLESCLETLSPQVTNVEISNRNSTARSGAFSKVMADTTQTPLNCEATTNVKEIQINLSNNLSSRTKDPLKFKTVKLSPHPLKLVKISTLNGSSNVPFRNNNTNNLKPEYEESLNLSKIKEISKNSRDQPDLRNNFNKSYSDWILNSKPNQMIKHLKNSAIMLNRSKPIPVNIVSKSKDSENIKVTQTATSALPLNAKSSTNAPVVSLLKPKIISNAKSSPNKSSSSLITNIEILAPLQASQIARAATSNNRHQNLKIQIVKHKFQCHFCWKIFKQKSALTRHLRTHTGEKPYKCNLCHKSYSDASNFKKHKMLHKKAADALNISRPPAGVSPHLPGHYQPHCNSPTHSTASDPDPDGMEVKTLTKFGSSCSSMDEENDDIESTTSSSMESLMWQQALGYAIKNDEVRSRVIRNLSGINNSIMPSDIEPVLLHDPLKNTFTCEDPD